jgi:hypothetical protein
MTKEINDKRQEEDRKRKNQDQEPSVAPSMEMDELEVEASPKEVKKGDSTSVTKLVIDRFD